MRPATFSPSPAEVTGRRQRERVVAPKRRRARPRAVARQGLARRERRHEHRERASTTDAHTKAERDERDAGTRRLGWVFLGLAAGVGMLWLAVLS